MVVFKKLINRYFDELAHRSSFLNRRFFQQFYKIAINRNTDMFFHNTRVLHTGCLVKGALEVYQSERVGPGELRGL